MKAGSKRKSVIHTLLEDLLGRFADVPLLSRYDVHQRLMGDWADVVQDDIYLVATDGWVNAARMGRWNPPSMTMARPRGRR